MNTHLMPVGVYVIFLSMLCVAGRHTNAEPVKFAKVADSVKFLPVGRLFGTDFFSTTTCTATLVGPKVAITARHCVVNGSSFSDDFGKLYSDLPLGRVVLKFENGKQAEISNIVVSDKQPFTPINNMGKVEAYLDGIRDIAILELEEDLGTQVGFLSMDFADPLERVKSGQFIYKAVGYPGSGAGSLNESSGSCRIGFLRTIRSPTVTLELPTSLMQTDCLTEKGFSGGPLVEISPEGTIKVIGVISAQLQNDHTLVAPIFNQTWVRSYFGR